MINPRQLLKSFRCALRGMVYTWKEEQNFRIQILCAIVVLACAYFLKASLLEAGLLALAIGGVLALELVNTVVEKISDALKPRIDTYLCGIKVLLAAAVLVWSLGSLMVGFFFFFPKIFSLL